MRTNRGQNWGHQRHFLILLKNIFTKDKSYTRLVMFTNNVNRVNFDFMRTLKNYSRLYIQIHEML